MSHINVYDEYRKISEKLKKKMFRKIPYTQVAEQFMKLSQDLQRYGQSHHAALCMLSSAQCEQSNQQYLSQSQTVSLGLKQKPSICGAYFFIQAGRIFATSAIHENNIIQYFTPEEFVTEAIQAFQQSIEIYDPNEEYGLCETLCFELAYTLKILGRYHESGEYFVKSYNFSKKSNHRSLQIDALKEAYECNIEVGDFELATETLQILVTLINQQQEFVSYLQNSDHLDKSSSKTSTSTEGTNHMFEKETLQSKNDSRRLNYFSLALQINESMIEAVVNLVLVLLIQKRTKEAGQTLSDYIPKREKSQQTLLLAYLYDNLIPLLRDLLECCNEDDINSMRFLLENELKFGAGLSSTQKRLLSIVQHVHENPLYLTECKK